MWLLPTVYEYNSLCIFWLPFALIFLNLHWGWKSPQVHSSNLDLTHWPPGQSHLSISWIFRSTQSPPAVTPPSPWSPNWPLIQDSSLPQQYHQPPSIPSWKLHTTQFLHGRDVSERTGSTFQHETDRKESSNSNCFSGTPVWKRKDTNEYTVWYYLHIEQNQARWHYLFQGHCDHCSWEQRWFLSILRSLLLNFHKFVNNW